MSASATWAGPVMTAASSLAPKIAPELEFAPEVRAFARKGRLEMIVGLYCAKMRAVGEGHV